jgi:hypothetical protein
VLGLPVEARKKGSIESYNRVSGAHLTIAFALVTLRERRRHITRSSRLLFVLACVRDLGDLDFDLEVVGGEESWQKLEKSDIRSIAVADLAETRRP